MPSLDRFMMTMPAIHSHVGGGGGRMFYGTNRADVASGMVKRCVMRRDLRRGRIEDQPDPGLERLGCRQTGRSCGPGGRGDEYECPAMSVIGTAPGMASLTHMTRTGPRSWRWDVRPHHIPSRGPATAILARRGLGELFPPGVLPLAVIILGAIGASAAWGAFGYYLSGGKPRPQKYPW